MTYYVQKLISRCNRIQKALLIKINLLICYNLFSSFFLFLSVKQNYKIEFFIHIIFPDKNSRQIVKSNLTTLNSSQNQSQNTNLNLHQFAINFNAYYNIMLEINQNCEEIHILVKLFGRSIENFTKKKRILIK